MKPYWDFLVSALQDQLGKEWGQLVAWLFCISVILVVVVPLYMIMKAATKLGSRRDADMGVIPGINDPVTMSQPAAASFTSAQSQPVASYPGVVPPLAVPEVQSQIDTPLSSQNIQRNNLAASRYISLAVFAMMIAGAIFARRTNPINAFGLLPLVLIGFGLVKLSRSSGIRLLLSAKPSVKISRTVTVREPLVVKLNNETVQKARALLSTGQDLESVCREIEPAYANWSFPQQQGFRRAMETVLKTQLGAGTSSRTTF
jgi:hypothetical protein